MKKILLVVLFVWILFGLSSEVLDKIIARVSNDVILLSDLLKQINQMKSAKMYPPEMKEMDVLQQMIESRLIIQKAKELNYTVDEAKIKSVAERRIRNIKSQYGSEEEFNLELRRMKLSYYDLLKYFTDILSEQALTQQFYKNKIATKVMISDKETLTFYQAHKDTLAVKPVTWEIGMIVRQIKASEATEKTKLAQINKIKERIKDGASFEKLAREESDCPSREKGGDLGFFTRGMMVKPFEEAAFSLQLGEVSDAVKTQYGYHLITLEEKKGEELRVRHILKIVQPSAADSLSERNLMESLRQKYLSGIEFSSLATAYSIDEESAKDGGSIGEYSAEDFPELFAPVLSILALRQISDVLEHEGNLYLFAKLNEIPSRLMSYEEVKSQIKEILLRKKQMQVYEDWIEQLKQEAYIEILI